MSKMQSPVRVVIVIVLLVSLLLAWFSVAQRSEDALVVYCAHDLIFAEKILQDFETETGIKVVVVGDSEATKSLGLVQRLIREKDNPQCDVFWNNQLLGTMDLAEHGVLTPYQGSGFQRIPDRFKDSSGLWTGFAGRLRVWIVNTEVLEASEQAISKRFESKDLSRMVIAMPMYGTTLSHFSVLWETMEGEELKNWYQNLTERGCQVVPGNSTVKNLVSEQVCDFGWTDTDDFFVGIDSDAHIEMMPIRVDGKTLCLPNTVAMIRGTKKPDAAGKLIDYLLSAKVEIALANSGSRQIPLGEVDMKQLPKEVVELIPASREAIDITRFSESRQQCLKWLQTKQLR